MVVKRVILGASLLAVLAPVVQAKGGRSYCNTLYTAAGTKHKADRIFAGIRHVALKEYRNLGYREMGLANQAMRAPVRAYDHKRRAQHSRRVQAAQRAAQSLSAALASWYYDGGATASGWHAYYGIANKYLPFGTHVLICYPYGSSRCVLTTVDDRGPYVGSRTFDLNQDVASALGFGGVGTVGYRIE
jgi:rare lipoprotein A (peptidoglycan hydrolase)